MGQGEIGSGVRGRDIWKTYNGGKHVLKGIDIDIEERSMTLIQGRSGSGKTTLLSIIGCMDVPTKGDLFLNGIDTSKLNPKELAQVRLNNIGFVFQTHNLIDDLTISENILLPLKIAKDRSGENRVKELLEAFNITGISENLPNEVSGGERQRAAIARALANNPSIILADEPTASLDLENSENVIDAFKKVRSLFHTTIVIAAHDPLIPGHVDRIFKLSNGILEVQG